MERDRLAHQPFYFGARVARGTQTGEIWRAGALARGAFLVYHIVSMHLAVMDDDRGLLSLCCHCVFPLSPAWRRMLLTVPGGMSVTGWPGIVTVPGLVGCLNCR